MGHSFVRRFQRFCHGINNGGLDSQFFPFVVRGQSAYLGQQFIFTEAPVKVHLQIGGNDLNADTCQPDQLAKHILQLAQDFINYGGVSQVAISSFVI